jgi:hypothetical protein
MGGSDPSFKDLEFAGVIVQKLSLILMTSPELAEFRRRLKSLETRVRDLSHPTYPIADRHIAARRSGVVYDPV